MPAKIDPLQVFVRLFPVLIGLCKDLADARKKSSDRGRKITKAEALEIAHNAWDRLRPSVLDVLDLDEDDDGKIP